MRPSDLSLVGEKGSVGMSERERDCGGEYLIGIRSHECVRWGGGLSTSKSMGMLDDDES